MGDRQVVDTGTARLLIGLAQGVALLFLRTLAESESWPDTWNWAFAAALLVASFVPALLLAGLTQMRGFILAAWSVVAAAALVVFAIHDLNREGTTERYIPSFAVFIFSAVAMFIAHHLVAAADAERKLIAPYRAYFDIAWKNGVQLALSLAFTGVFWLLLWLGAALFDLIKITVVGEVIGERWFVYPVTGLAFGAAVHLSDVRMGLINGIRSVALMLLSWLLPVMALFALAFLAALAFVGLEPLWATFSATALLLSAAATIIILINAAYQDGLPDNMPHVVLKWAARGGAVALVLLVALAAYAVWLRVDQHGLTADRVIVGAVLLIAAAYAVGYAVAAIWPGAWFKPLEAANIAVSFVILGVITALLTPIGDPARIGVADQLRRLQAGVASPETFDFNHLRFDAGRYGTEALERLARDKSTPRAQTIAAKAQEALDLSARPSAVDPEPAGLLAQIIVYPKGRGLPESFVKQDWQKESASPLWCARGASPSEPCEAFLIDFDGDGAEEILLSERFKIGVYRLKDDVWRWVGYIDPTCAQVLPALREGRFAFVQPALPELEIDGKRVRVQGCAP